MDDRAQRTRSELRGPRPTTPREAPAAEATGRALLVLNARSASAASALEPGLAPLRARGVEVQLVRIQRPGETAALVRREGGGADRVIVAGGDGTINAALPAVLALGLPMGVIPLGTANDLARTLGLPTETEAACAVIAAGRCRAVDVGEVNGTPFLNVASIGLGVSATRRLGEIGKSRWGVFSYPRALLDALRSSRAFRVRIECDGRGTTGRSIHVAVGNGCYYGGGTPIAEDARIDDGALDLYSIEPQSLPSLLAVAAAVRLGRQAGLSGVVTRRGREIHVETDRPRLVTADGEVRERTPAHFRVRPRALRVYAPESADV